MTLGAPRPEAALAGSSLVAAACERGANISGSTPDEDRCRTEQQAADTKRTHKKRHARRLATHLQAPKLFDLQEKARRE
jgi:hypothetical protein